MKTFDTVAKLKLAKLKEGQFVETGGYYTKGDEGAARYLIVTPQAADGYRDHGLANGNIAVLQSALKVNVSQFGAVGDGIVDDTLALQAAFTLTDGTVVIPEGNFLHKGLVINTSITVQGGRDSTLAFLQQSIGQIGISVTSNNVTLEGFTVITTPNGFANGEAIQSDSFNDIIYRNLLIDDGHYGLSVKNTAMDTAKSNNITIANVRVKNTTSSGFDIRGCHRSAIHNNIAKNCGTDGFKFAQSCSQLSISGNISSDNARDGFDFYDGLVDSSVCANIASGNALLGFEIKGTFDGSDYVVRDNTFSGNTASGNTNNGFTVQSVRNITMSGNISTKNTLSGFFYNTVQGCVFIGEQSTKNIRHGFDTQLSSRCVYTGCVAADNSWSDGVNQNGTYHGFNLGSDTDGMQLDGCRALNSPTSGIRGGQGLGMNFASNSNANRITGGRYDDNVTGPFNADGFVTANNSFLYLDETGILVFGAYTGIAAETLTGYITIKDESGTSRKLGVIA